MTSSTTKGSKIKGQPQPTEESESTKSSKSIFWEKFKHSQMISPSTKTFYRGYEVMKTTRSTKSRSPETGSGPSGEQTTFGGKESSTSKSLKGIRWVPEADLRRPPYLTGNPEKYIQTTTTKRPFTLSQHSPSTLLCTPCGQSTFILTLERIGRKHFIVTRCTNCGNRGKTECVSLKKILS